MDEEARLKRIVREGVAEALADLGLHPDERQEIRRDMTHLRKWRVAVEKASNTVAKSAIVVIVSGIIGGTILILKSLLGITPPPT